MTAYKTVNGELVELTADEVANELAKVQIHEQQRAIEEKIRYQSDRRKEYPSIEDVVVALIENQEGDPAALNKVKALRAQVKAKYPKNG